MRTEALFGGKTRFAVLEALSEAKRPMTAYQIAIAKGLDPAVTYRCLAEYSTAGITEPIKEQNQTSYALSKGAGKAAAGYLRSLKQKPPEPVDLEDWLSPDVQAERMEKIARIGRTEPKTGKSIAAGEILSRRASGELAALAASSKIAFNELFEKKNNIFVLRER